MNVPEQVVYCEVCHAPMYKGTRGYTPSDDVNLIAEEWTIDITEWFITDRFHVVGNDNLLACDCGAGYRQTHSMWIERT
jgi:predicted SprT family Zn-dependent metalloprotease